MSGSCGWAVSGSRRKIDELDEAARHHRADLEIAAERPREHAADVELELVAQDAAGRRGRDHGGLLELILELLGEREHLVLGAVVRDQRDHAVHAASVRERRPARGDAAVTMW